MADPMSKEEQDVEIQRRIAQARERKEQEAAEKVQEQRRLRSVPKDVPPKTQREQKKSNVRTSPTTPRPGQYVEAVEGFYAMMGFGIGLIDKHVDDNGKYVGSCGLEIANLGHDAALAWDKAAQKHPAIASMLDSLGTSSVFAELIAAHIPLVATITQHHGSALKKFRGKVKSTIPSGGKAHDFTKEENDTPAFNDLSGVYNRP